MAKKFFFQYHHSEPSCKSISGAALFDSKEELLETLQIKESLGSIIDIYEVELVETVKIVTVKIVIGVEKC